jgi:hypothetical protein
LPQRPDLGTAADEVAAGAFDFAVCGASPFAGLLAGLLATAHGKRVCIVGEPWSPYRLQRNFDLSVMPATRPETWALLKRGGAETLKLVGGLGRGLFERVDPLFVAESGDAADYLGHMRWVALGLGFAAERATERAITTDGAICRIRDAAMLVPGRAEPAIDAWLAKAEVRRIGGETAISLRRDGTYALAFGDHLAEAAAVVLADDEAILRRLPVSERHRLLSIDAATSLLTEPAKPLAAPFIHYLDRAVAVHQRAGKGPIAAIAAGESDDALPRIGASLGAQGPLRRTGQTVFQAVTTLDGAPLVTRMGKAKLSVVAGLGASAAFFAPVVARVLAGSAADDERDYFAARDGTRPAARPSVAETTLRIVDPSP